VNRSARVLDDLAATLRSAEELANRGRGQFDADPALPLAFEALANRVGDQCKQLVAIDADRFSHPMWSLAARNRDFIVHHYNRVDPDVLWSTITTSFPQLAALVHSELH
jgi:uncharacterized protein with HEPN domain